MLYKIAFVFYKVFFSPLNKGYPHILKRALLTKDKKTTKITTSF